MRTQRFCSALFVLAAVFALAWLPTAAHAQISLSVPEKPVAVLPGQTELSVFGSLTNAGPDPLELDNAYFNIDSGPNGADLTSTFLPSSYPIPTTLDAGQVYSGVLFTLDLDPASPLGTYGGNFSVSYGGSAVGKDVYFNLESPAAVPEASTLPLLGLGLIVILGMLYRRRQTQSVS